MKKTNLAKRLIYCALLVAALQGCAGGADTEKRPELNAFYEFLFSEVEKQTGYNVEENEFPADSAEHELMDLAHDRVINAANRASEHMKGSEDKSYTIELPYLISVEKDPKHFEIEITRRRLTELGVLEP